MRCVRKRQQSVGASVCAIGAGAIMDLLARRELKTEIGNVYRVMVYAVVTKRMAPSEEIAGAAAFLSGPDDCVSSPAGYPHRQWRDRDQPR